MKTGMKTVGFGGGFTDARTMRPERRATRMVQVCHCDGARMAAYEDARPVLQHRTGASNCGRQLTEDSIARMPRWKRWGLYAAVVLLMTGVAPMALASFLICLCDLAGWWLITPLLIAAGCAFWRVMWS